MNNFLIGNTEIGGEKAPCLIIGEIGQAHDGSLGTAHAYIDAIADAGADAVKFQTHIAEAESTSAEPWRVKFSRQDKSRFDYWQRMEFSPEQWKGLKDHCDERGIIFLSSPFSFEAIDLLNNLGIIAWKVASGEVNNIPLIKKLVATRLPILLSSGMSYPDELDQVVEICRTNHSPFALLQCTTSYPCPPERIGLNIMQEYGEKYKCPIGLSDHSGEIYPGLAALVKGAKILEVHVTFHKNMFGPDVPASLDLTQLSELIRGVRYTEKILQNPVNKLEQVDSISSIRKLFTKSIIAKSNLQAGKLLSINDVTFKKPGTGIPSNLLEIYEGRRLQKDIPAGDFLKDEDFCPIN